MADRTTLIFSLIAGAGLLLLVIGEWFRAIVRRRERSGRGEVKIMVKPTDDAERTEGKAFEGLRVQLAGLGTMIPGIPALPVRPIDYQGWFEDVRKRMEIRSEQRTLDEQIGLWRRYDELYRQYLGLMRTAYALAEKSHDFRRLGDKVSLDDAELKLKQRQVEISLKELDLRDAELDMKIRRVREGTTAPEKQADEHLRAAFKPASDIAAIRRIEKEEAAKYPDDPDLQARIHRVADDLCARLMGGK